MKFSITLSMFAALCCAAFAQNCEAEKAAKSVVGQKASCCDSVGKLSASTEAEFMAEASRMMQAAEGKQECCKSTASKPIAKGEDACCSAKWAPAKFKVFIAGHGYQYFGCEDSASTGRKEWIAKGAKVGRVQKVSSKVSMS